MFVQSALTLCFLLKGPSVTSLERDCQSSILCGGKYFCAILFSKDWLQTTRVGSFLRCTAKDAGDTPHACYDGEERPPVFEWTGNCTLHFRPDWRWWHPCDGVVAVVIDGLGLCRWLTTECSTATLLGQPAWAFI